MTRGGGARTAAPGVLALAAVLALAFAACAPGRELRVCADPNNLPASNRRLDGFENRVAELVARELGAELSYTWWAQRRGFLRNTLNAGTCDLVAGIPATSDLLLTTRPYYRSTYVFLWRRGEPGVRTFDDPSLRTLRVAVQLVGDDYANTPPAHALAARGIVSNVTGYSVYGDYRRDSPPAAIIEAVARGEVDVAVVWGPLAGYFAPRQAVPLDMAAVSPQVDLPFLPMVFDIAMGVRRGDEALRDEVDAALVRLESEIERILDEYGVPRLPLGATGRAAMGRGAP